MVVESFARGGAERQILALSEGLLQRRYDVRVIELTGVVPGQSNFEGELAQLGIPLWNAGKFPAAAAKPVEVALTKLAPFASLLPGNLETLCQGLAAAIAEFQPGIVSGWSDIANLIGGFVAGAMDVRRVIVGQRVLPPPFWFGDVESNLYRQAYRQLAGNSRVTFVNHSVASAKEYEKWIDLAPGTVEVVYNGLSPSSMKVGAVGDRARCRASFGLPPESLVVGGLMRFAPEKDPGLWIETAAAIAAARPDAFFLLGGYGHGAIAEELLRKGAQLGLGARLVMPGAIAGIRPFYGALDVFLLTSRSENLGNVMIEAQAAGVPVVGPAVGGVGETMRDGVTGLLVADRSAASLAAAVLRILADADWRKRVEIEGPAFIARKFDHQRMVAETVAIYRRNGFLGGLLGWMPKPSARRVFAAAPRQG